MVGEGDVVGELLEGDVAGGCLALEGWGDGEEIAVLGRVEDSDGPFGAKDGGEVEDQRDEVGGIAAFDDDRGFEWWSVDFSGRLGQMFKGVEGRQACQLVGKGTEEDEGDDGREADDTRSG